MTDSTFLPKCQICPRTIRDGPLYRHNEKGVAAIWRCGQHVGDKTPDSLVKEIGEAIHAGK